MRFVQQIFPRPWPFPPSTRRALPASSPTSSVLRPRPTSRHFVLQIAACGLPGLTHQTPLSVGSCRDLPAPALVPDVNVPNSKTPVGESYPRPLFSDAFHGLPRNRTRQLATVTEFQGSIARPAHSSSYASPRGSPHVAQGMDFSGVDSSRGKTCS